MKDPYKVLEINRGASKEEIQKAYRRLVKKYHPDQYQNHPLQKGYSYGSENAFFEQVRIHINNGDLNRAEQMLNQTDKRTAEWFYLKGLIFQRKGWYAQARSHFQTAVNMEPGNAEYNSALNMMNYNNNMYRERSGGYGNRDMDDLCTICQCLICTDCCCECMGGDFITCC